MGCHSLPVPGLKRTISRTVLCGSGIAPRNLQAMSHVFDVMGAALFGFAALAFGLMTTFSTAPNRKRWALLLTHTVPMTMVYILGATVTAFSGDRFRYAILKAVIFPMITFSISELIRFDFVESLLFALHAVIIAMVHISCNTATVADPATLLHYSILLCEVLRAAMQS